MSETDAIRSLRWRLALMAIALAVPVAIGVALWQVRARRSTVEESLAESLADRALDLDLARCEADPERWPRTPRAWRQDRPRREARQERLQGRAGRVRGLWAYDGRFRPASPDAPALDRELRDALTDAIASGDERPARAAVTVERGRREVVLAAARVPHASDASPCAVLVATRPAGPARAPLLRMVLPSLAIAAASILIALLVSGPLFRRIRLQIDALRARDAALRDYVADTTHDVMLPLTVIQGHLATMKRRIASGGAVDGETLAAALEETHYLASLVANLSAAAKLDAGAPALALHPTELGPIVERVIARHAPIAKQRQIELDFAVPEAPLRAHADEVLVEQAVSNLVHNAIRYASQGGHVAVVLEAEGPDAFTIRVVDDGPGIPDEQLPGIRERRVRGGDTARTRHPHGLGLGLAITHDVAQKHGWALELGKPPGADHGLEAVLRGKRLT